MNELQKENDELRVLLKERETECIHAKDYMVKQAGVVNELAAHIERLRKAYYENKWIDDRDYAVLGVLKETPARSLIHIQAQVEEETIKRCANTARLSYNLKTAVLNIEYQQRKYANQLEAGTLPTAKEGE